VNVPANHVLVAFNKSGVATKKNLQVGACVIDEDYQGEIHIHLINVGCDPTSIDPGDKIIQLVLLPTVYESVEITETEESLWKGKLTERGGGGFGSTGNK
jgi:dUTP pyrophosphatase